MPGFAAVLKKYGPLGVALLALAYLLHHSEQRADRNMAWLMNELGQDLADVKKSCEKGK
jgi:hypothetical protein